MSKFINQSLSGKNANEKAHIKAAALSACGKFSFNANGFNIEVLKIAAAGSDLVMNLKVMKDGKQIAVNNPFIFRNPPIMVPDGTYREEIEDGKVVKKANFKEDGQAAIKSIIADTLRIVTK